MFSSVEETENLIPCSQDKRGISDLGNFIAFFISFLKKKLFILTCLMVNFAFRYSRMDCDAEGE